MPSSPPSSPPCGTCRIDWRPSRLEAVALVVLALLAAGAVIASAVPAPFRDPLAGLVALHGLLLARRAAAAPRAVLEWSGEGGARVRLRRGHDVFVLRDVAIDRRWPLWRLQARDARGRRHRLIWWPDTLAPADRRRLARVANDAHHVDPTTDTRISLPSMAA